MVRHNSGPKIQQEQETIRLMIHLYCRHKHYPINNQLCDECAELLQYAVQRLSMCRFGEQKTACKLCPRHCYRTDYKVRIKAVMRFSGPRMIVHHPIKMLQHLYKSIVYKPMPRIK